MCQVIIGKVPKGANGVTILNANSTTGLVDVLDVPIVQLEQEVKSKFGVEFEWYSEGLKLKEKFEKRAR